MVYVLDKDGRPLMPTTRHGKVRRLLRDGLAVCDRQTPFTIRLLYETTAFIQDVTLGVDAGSKTVGLSATTDKKEFFKAELTLRNDIVNALSTRREARRSRRCRKCRHRAPRFDNRRRPEGWLAPSVKQKVDSHIKAVGLVCSILPVKKITVEVAQFDTQWIKNPALTGTDYQHGPQLGFWNVREYVLFRDGHKCIHCHGRSKDPVLNVHHIESRKTGGDSPDNLVTLCGTCHKAHHVGTIELNLKRASASLRDAAFMSVMRWTVYHGIKDLYPDKTVRISYGYITKYDRIGHGIEKTHCAEAFCIAKNLDAKRLDATLRGRCIARHSRSLHLSVPKKGSHRRSTVASHWIGKSRFQRFDTVEYNGRRCLISGSTDGRPILRDTEWRQVAESPSVNPKKIQFIQRKKGSTLWL